MRRWSSLVRREPSKLATRVQIPAGASMVRKQIWNKKKIIKELKNLERELGYSPTQTDAGSALVSAAVKYFGNWNKAKRTAGLEIYINGRRGGRTQEIREYLDRNPSTAAEIMDALHLEWDEVRVITGAANIYRIGPRKHGVYYLKNQKYLALKHLNYLKQHK